MSNDMGATFKALADPTRRQILDMLRCNNGQTLGQLCDELEMARQSATQHIALLERANLISVVWQGRKKLHYLNPVPLREIQDRWIRQFEYPRLDMLGAVKQQAEEASMSDKPAFVYVTYIESTAERVWEAITDADLSARWWGHHNVSDWNIGSTWEHQRTDGTRQADVVGEVIEADPPRRLVLTGQAPGDDRPKGPGRITLDIEPLGEIVRLRLTEDNFRDEAEADDAAAGWAAVLSNLKSFLETGSPLPRDPWLP